MGSNSAGTAAGSGARGICWPAYLVYEAFAALRA